MLFIKLLSIPIRAFCLYFAQRSVTCREDDNICSLFPLTIAYMYPFQSFLARMIALGAKSVNDWVV